MKKLLICVFILLISSSVHLNAFSPTGYDLFSKIDFNDDGKLLIDITPSEIEKGYEAMGKRSFWGWKHHFFTIQEQATYIGEIIFAKSNRSKQPMKVNYDIKETEYSEKTVKVSGSLSPKFVGNIKKINTTISAQVQGDYTNKDTATKVEQTSFTAIIEPNTRLVYRITGDAFITNGVSKQFIMGITFKKGAWEYIDIITRYYELYEEKIVE